VKVITGSTHVTVHPCSQPAKRTMIDFVFQSIASIIQVQYSCTVKELLLVTWQHKCNWFSWLSEMLQGNDHIQ